MNLKMPDVTLAQILAVVTFAVGQAVAYGWLNDETSKVVLSAASAVVAVAWKLADAYLRGKRNEVRAAALVAGQVDPAIK